jgi:hypothetical protein
MKHAVYFAISLLIFDCGVVYCNPSTTPVASTSTSGRPNVISSGIRPNALSRSFSGSARIKLTIPKLKFENIAKNIETTVPPLLVRSSSAPPSAQLTNSIQTKSVNLSTSSSSKAPISSNPAKVEKKPVKEQVQNLASEHKITNMSLRGLKKLLDKSKDKYKELTTISFLLKSENINSTLNIKKPEVFKKLIESEAFKDKILEQLKEPEGFNSILNAKHENFQALMKIQDVRKMLETKLKEKDGLISLLKNPITDENFIILTNVPEFKTAVKEETKTRGEGKIFNNEINDYKITKLVEMHEYNEGLYFNKHVQELPKQFSDNIKAVTQRINSTTEKVISSAPGKKK